MNNNKKWYEQPVIIVLCLIFFFPVGLALMWIFANWNKNVKIIITGFFAFFMLIGILTEKDETINQNNTATNQEEQITTVEQTSPKDTQTIKEEPKPQEKIEINVTSQIIKKVNGKYRYFFDIRNNDVKGFEGEVTITLNNDIQSTPLGYDTFKTKQLIEPSIGKSVYIDINTSPSGLYGPTHYKYMVKSSNGEINEGEGEISDEFEDLDF